MAIKVLVVDDSGFFRRRLTEILSSDPAFEVVGTATDGRDAVEKAQELRPDVITMDYEMPVMDGISAVKQIMQRCPTPVLMFSSLTHEGARVTLDALEAGAVDYLPKNFEDISRNPERLKQMLYEKIRAVALTNKNAWSRGRTLGATTATSTAPAKSQDEPKPELSLLERVRQRRSVTTTETKAPLTTATSAPAPLASKVKPKSRAYKLVAIGTSTGGPVALQKVLTTLPANFPAPIVLIQHMPAAFTNAFAERLNKLCNIEVREAQDGDLLRPGLALLAPGGKQMMIDQRGQVRVLDGDERLNYKPSVDVTFGSAAKVYNDRVLAVVLTGMGADGREGARMLKSAGSQVWAQDEASCVIYGMPMAVIKADLADSIYSLDEVGPNLIEACQ